MKQTRTKKFSLIFRPLLAKLKFVSAAPSEIVLFLIGAKQFFQFRSIHGFFNFEQSISILVKFIEIIDVEIRIFGQHCYGFLKLEKCQRAIEKFVDFFSASLIKKDISISSMNILWH